MSSPVSQVFEDVAARQPETAAFRFRTPAGWRTWTYAMVLAHSRRLARGLLALGLTPGTRAVVLFPPSPRFFCLILAMLRTGIVPVLADPRAGWTTLGRGLAATRATVFVAPRSIQAVAAALGWVRPGTVTRLTPRQILHAPDTPAEEPAIAPEQEAAVIFTSGSTGPAKAVVLTQANLQAQVESVRTLLAPGRPETDLPTLPLFALLDLLLGLTAVLPFPGFPPPAKLPRRLIHELGRHRVDTLFASPVVLRLLRTEGRRTGADLGSLRTLVTAGASAAQADLEGVLSLLRPEARFLGVYGSTECLLVSAVDHRMSVSTPAERGAGRCVGSPLGVQVRILSDAEPAPLVRGEIVVEGPPVSALYAYPPEANLQGKLPAGGRTAHRMGDAGYLDDQGRLWFSGRVAHRVETDRTLYSEEYEGVFNGREGLGRTALAAGTAGPVLWVEGIRRGEQSRIRELVLRLAAGHELTRGLADVRFLKKFPSDARHNSKILRERLPR